MEQFNSKNTPIIVLTKKIQKDDLKRAANK
ncbi:hypothetical protein ATE90_1749 [Polaribacter sp. Hel1_33_96]|jgi:hypothetical protein|nr:hypothetical protein ATE90_1749 [Polaribacter sp. Hel1_33_96]